MVHHENDIIMCCRCRLINNDQIQNASLQMKVSESETNKPTLQDIPWILINVSDREQAFRCLGEIVLESALLLGRKYWGLELGESLDKMFGQQLVLR